MNKIRTEREVRFADLVDPSAVGIDGQFHLLSGEVAMGVYEWLLTESMRMSDPKRGILYWPEAFHAVTGKDWRYRESGKLIDVSPFGWRRWLANRFRHILLTPHGPRTMVGRFFASIGVGLDKTRVVPVRHHADPRDSVTSLVTTIGGHVGRTLAKSYNPAHPGAVEIHDIRLQWDRGWWVSVRYGFPWPDHGSNWTLDEDDVPGFRVCAEEGFGEFVHRVAAQLDSLVVPTQGVHWSVYAIFDPKTPHKRLGYVLAPTHESAFAYWCETMGGDTNVATRSITQAAVLPKDALDRRCALRLSNVRVGEYCDEEHGRSEEIRALLEAMTVPPAQRSRVRPDFNRLFKGDFDD